MNWSVLAADFGKFWGTMGFQQLTVQQGIMIGVSCVLLYLALHHKFEPLLLLPIAFGSLLTNFPLTSITDNAPGGLLFFLYQGVELDLWPCLIFLGLGAMTDFGPLLADPKTFLLGAAAQFGVFGTLMGAL
ncbi:MAG TPA: sodium ion-translocating decarboxylase subunit beta, partial [bacterium]|nr:sodium ion-translocating decarboxylase subunit beta [bacterium]